MKKAVSILLSLVSAICIAFAFGGCGEKQPEQVEQVEGRLYQLNYAYSQGWIEEDDVKSIACCYYDWRSFGTNPYSGAFSSTQQLSKETENEIIKVYDGASDDAKIFKYFGTYDGNIAVALGYENTDYEDFEARDCVVGDVVFPDFRYIILVYHYAEQSDPTLKLSGRLRSLQSAFEEKLIDEDDLKSISCCLYEQYGDGENPYSGLYVKPAERLNMETKHELKQAYLQQIDRQTAENLDGIIIHKYYGLYKGYIVAAITGYGCGLGVTAETEIGGVTFCHESWSCIYVYYTF